MPTTAQEPEMPPGKRYRLLARAEIDGAIRDPGYLFTLPDGVRGPHRTVQSASHGALGHGVYRDEPLYAEVKDEPRPAPEIGHARSIVDEGPQVGHAVSIADHSPLVPGTEDAAKD